MRKQSEVPIDAKDKPLLFNMTAFEMREGKLDIKGKTISNALTGWSWISTMVCYHQRSSRGSSGMMWGR